MSQQPFTPAALRGAVDLSGLARRSTGAGRPGTDGPHPGSPAGPPGSATGAPAGPGSGAGVGSPASGDVADTTGPQGSGVPGTSGSLVHAGDANFESVVNASLRTPMVLVLWTPQLPETVAHLRELAAAAHAQDGRFQVVGVDLTANPGILQALTPILQQAFGQISSLPVVVGLLGGQPMPFYLGVQDMAQVDQLLEQFLQAAVTNGIAGRVDVSVDGDMPAADGNGPEGGSEEDEPALPPLHQKAYDAIEAGDWAAAIEAYEEAAAADPNDEMARLGLGQVRLLQRASTLDATAVRAAAAADRTDVQAQIDAADLDAVGGHVEDAFARLIDTVRVTVEDDREKVRTHLLGLFEVIGAQDERVIRARRALMSALF